MQSQIPEFILENPVRGCASPSGAATLRKVATPNPRWTNATKWPKVSLTRQPWTPPSGRRPRHPSAWRSFGPTAEDCGYTEGLPTFLRTESLSNETASGTFRCTHQTESETAPREFANDAAWRFGHRPLRSRIQLPRNGRVSLQLVKHSRKQPVGRGTSPFTEASATGGLPSRTVSRPCLGDVLGRSDRVLARGVGPQPGEGGIRAFLSRPLRTAEAGQYR